MSLFSFFLLVCAFLFSKRSVKTHSLFLVKIKIKKPRAHLKKAAVSGWGPSPATSCPQACPESGLVRSSQRLSSRPAARALPTPAAREVSACGFPISEPQEWKEMSLKYHEGRAEQMLFQLQCSLLSGPRPSSHGPCSSIALERIARLSSMLFNAKVRGAPERWSRLELCPTPHFPGRFLLSPTGGARSQPAAPPARRTRGHSSHWTSRPGRAYLVPLRTLFPQRRRCVVLRDSVSSFPWEGRASCGSLQLQDPPRIPSAW